MGVPQRPPEVGEGENEDMPPPLVDVGVPPPPLPNFDEEQRENIIITNAPTAEPVPVSFQDLVLGNVPAVTQTGGRLPTPAGIQYAVTNLRRPANYKFGN